MEYQWFAIYTRSRFEKKIYAKLQEIGIESYLPLYKVIRQWKDRKKLVEEPLLRSYIFVKVNPKEYFEVFKIDGVVRYVCFSGKAAPINESQIKSLKIALSNNLDVSILEKNNIPHGHPIKIVEGSLTGFEGELVKFMGKKHVMIRMEQIGRTISVKVPLEYIEVIEKV